MTVQDGMCQACQKGVWSYVIYLFYLVSFLPLPDKRQWRVQDGMCQACQKGQTAGHAVKTLTLKGCPYQRLWKYGFRCACCYLPQTLKPDTAKPTP